MGDLSANFSRREFRCRHCGRDGVDMRLVEALQQLRAAVGGPLVVTSGYRCREHPIERAKETPGTHARGIAADIVAPGVSLRRLYDLAVAIPAFRGGGIGVYPDTGHLHVDVRGHEARWGFRRGRMVELGAALALLGGERSDG